MTSKVSWKTDEGLQRQLKLNAERRDRERAKQGKDKRLEQVFTVIFVLGFVLFGIGWLAAGIATAVFLLSVGVISGIIASYVV